MTFVPGNDVGTMVCVNVLIVDDMVTIEPDQSFTILASSNDPVIIAPISEATVTIVDNDGEKSLCTVFCGVQ